MIPERCAPQLYAVMRIVFGLMFLTYGLQKFGIGGDAVPFFSYPFGIAGIIEVIVGVLVVLGLFTAPAAFIASGEMAVALGPAKWPISGLLSAEYPMISVCPPRLTSGPQPAHDARPHPHRVFMQQRRGYVSRAWRATCATLQLRHLRTRAYTPRTNGKAERFIQTLLREWAYVEPYASSQERRTALRSYLRFYNRQRPHASLNYQPPWSRLTSAA